MRSMRTLAVLMGVGLLLGGCAAQRAYERALDLEQAELYYEAALQDLDALDQKPEFTEARTHLRDVAPKAYEEVLHQAEALESSGKWILAQDAYAQLEDLLARCAVHGVVFETIDLAARTRESRERGAAHHFDLAESLFEQQDYHGAMAEYENVVALRGLSFRQTRRQLWSCHTLLGAQHVDASEFDDAISHFQSALEYEDDETTRSALAGAHYDVAELAQAARDYRRAAEQFEASAAVLPDYRDASQRADEALELAIVDVVFMPFGNNTRFPKQHSQLLHDLLLESCVEIDSRYVYFWQGDPLRRLLGEHGGLNSGTLSSQTAASLADRGVDLVLRGAVEDIYLSESPPSFEEHSHEIVSEVDSAGTTLEVIDEVFYREYHSGRYARVKVSYSLIDTETGRVVAGPHRFDEDLRSHAHWIRYQGSVYDLPPDKQHLLDAPAEPDPPPVMIDTLVASIAQRIHGQIEERLR